MGIRIEHAVRFSHIVGVPTRSSSLDADPSSSPFWPNRRQLDRKEQAVVYLRDRWRESTIQFLLPTLLVTCAIAASILVR